MRLRGARFRGRGRGPSPLLSVPCVWLVWEPPGVAAGPLRAVARPGPPAGCRREGAQAARVTGRVTRTRTEGVELKR